MKPLLQTMLVAPVLVALACGLMGCGADGGAERGQRPPAPVEVAPVERGEIVLTRRLSGTLQARASFLAAPKVSGQIRELRVDLGDAVQRGDVLAVLDDRTFVQEVRQAEAGRAVAQATLKQAEAQAIIAERARERFNRLRDRAFASDAQFDTVEADFLAAQADLAVARAALTRAEAELEAARIQLTHTQVRADWREGGDTRVVARRFVDEGDTVGQNEPLFRVVDLDPVLGEIFVTEAEYPRVRVGDPVRLQTDAFPGQVFPGEVVRIAPVFSEGSRQARVEFQAPNPDLHLKPGMFVRVDLTLGREPDAVIIPELALVRRDDRTGVFLLTADGATVRWQTVTPGIRQGDRIQVIQPPLAGRVVVLGQQLLEDGSAVRIITASGRTGEEE
ncbi:MAG: efflux RND transporter periplasmic adaptor subunit [Opitutales bacterium]